MINLIKYRKIWYAISLVFIIPSMVALALWGLRPSIDFTGGTRWELSGTTNVDAARDFMSKRELSEVTIQRVGDNALSLRFKEIDEVKHESLKSELLKLGEGVKEESFEIIGPSVSKEITRNAFVSVLLASLVIIIFVGYSFRKVPRPANSWEFGFAAIAAVVHDVLIVCGVFAVLGRFYNVEIDPLFITAVLTVIGFSVHDTIVIFDRIRENLIKFGASDFEETVNLSILQSFPRALNTSFLVWVMLLILNLFGGATIRNFVLALVIGVFVGAYSSILTASPLLVTWQELKKKRFKKA